MKNRFDVELEVVTDLSPLELGSKIEQAVREALEAVGQSLGCDLAFELFLVLDRREVRFVLEPVCTGAGVSYSAERTAKEENLPIFRISDTL